MQTGEIGHATEVAGSPGLFDFDATEHRDPELHPVGAAWPPMRLCTFVRDCGKRCSRWEDRFTYCEKHARMIGIPKKSPAANVARARAKAAAAEIARAHSTAAEVLDHGLSYEKHPKAKVPISSISPIFWGGGPDFPGALGIDTETRPHPRKDGRDGQDGNLSFGMLFVAWVMALSGGSWRGDA